MNGQSPCATCKHGHKSKHKARCRDCERRIAYVESMEPGVECRNDPAYQAAYSTPPMFRSQLRTNPISTWDLSF
jgi:hypothetical protein